MIKKLLKQELKKYAEERRLKRKLKVRSGDKRKKKLKTNNRKLITEIETER
jgi:hypothetical protein